MSEVITPLTKCSSCRHTQPDVSFRIYAASKGEDVVRCDSCLWTPALQRKHEKALIVRDREARIAEQRRQEAERAIANGGVDFQSAVLGPTPEQLAHGEFGQFSIEMERQAARGAKGYRRMSVATPVKLWRDGKMTDDQLAACTWYRDRYDETGLEGRVGSVEIGKEVFGGTGPGLLFTERQLNAQDEFRFVRQFMTAHFVKFFDNVVLNDIPFTRAARLSKSGRNPHHTLRQLAEQIHSGMDALKKKV